MKPLKIIGAFIIAFAFFSAVITIKMPSKRLDLDGAITQGFLVLGMRSIDVVKAVGEPTKISEPKDGITAWYYEELYNPVDTWKIEHAYIMFKNGRLADIKKGEPLDK